MSLKKLGAIAAVASVGMSATAFADDGKVPGGVYVSIGGGFVWVDDVTAAGSTLEFDDGYSLSAAIGYDTGDMNELGKVRADLEIFYSDTDNDVFKTGGTTTNVTGGVENLGAFVNGYVDFMPGSAVRPYIGVGVGIVETDLSVSVGGFTASGSSTELAYRLAAGASYQVTDTIAVDLGYRYLAVNTNTEMDSHHLGASLRFGL